MILFMQIFVLIGISMFQKTYRPKFYVWIHSPIEFFFLMECWVSVECQEFVVLTEAWSSLSCWIKNLKSHNFASSGNVYWKFLLIQICKLKSWCIILFYKQISYTSGLCSFKKILFSDSNNSDFFKISKEVGLT